MVGVIVKTCSKCKIEKDEPDFYPSQLKNNSAKCKSCTQKYYQENKSKIQKYKTEYWHQNKEELYEYKKEWRKEYSHVVKYCNAHNIDYSSEECPICSGARNKKYKKEHEEEIKKYAELYRKENREQINQYYSNRRKNDPEYNIRRIISASVYSMIKSQGSSKGGSIVNYLPFTIRELKEHLENQFEPWMNWGNHGKYDATIWDDNDPATWTWNIDHVTPQSDLPYSSMEEENFKKCWALSNLRPLSAKQNMLDGAHKIRHKQNNYGFSK